MILVFGKTGQVATELDRLGGVLCLGRDEADFTDPAQCARRVKDHRPVAVINAVAYTAVDKAETEEAQAELINATTPGSIAAACADLDIPLVHISTDYVFAGTGSTPFSEGDAVDPQNAYGRTKRAGEAAIRQSGVRHAILRTSWVFSAHGANFVKTMLRLSETRDALSIVADQIGGPTPAADIAATCISLANGLVDGQAGGTYHYSGAPDVSWADFARAIFDKAGRPVVVTAIPTADYPTPAARPLNSRLDCAKLATDFGISRPDWKQGLDHVLNELGAS